MAILTEEEKKMFRNEVMKAHLDAASKTFDEQAGGGEGVTGF